MKKSYLIALAIVGITTQATHKTTYVRTLVPKGDLTSEKQIATTYNSESAARKSWIAHGKVGGYMTRHAANMLILANSSKKTSTASPKRKKRKQASPKNALKKLDAIARELGL